MDRTASPRRAAGLLAGTAAAALLGGLVPLAPATAAAQTPAPAAPTAAPATAAPTTAAPTTGRPPRLPALPAPGLVGPDETDTVLKHVVLDWEAVEGATSYQVQVGTDEGWSDEPTYTATTLSTQLTLPTWLPHASYVWRVAAARENGSGRWSSDGSFTRGWRDRPTPLAPAADARLDQFPQFSWTPVDDASAYELQVSDSPLFDQRRSTPAPSTIDNDPTQDQASAKVDTCFTTQTRVTVYTSHAERTTQDSAGPCASTLLGTGEPRYWRVRALDRLASDDVPDTDTTPASDEGVSHVPPAFEPLDPELVTACPGAATSSPTSSPSSSPTATPEGPAPSAGPVGCERGHAFEQGAWSAGHRFSVALPPKPADTTSRFRTLPPVQVQDLVTDNPCVVQRGQHVCSDMPTLRWSPVPGASSYRVYVSLTPTYSNLQEIADTHGLSFTPTDSWRDSTAGSAYYYAVQPCTVAGCGVVTSTPPSFRKSSPAVTLVGPEPAARLGARDVVFQWERLSRALQQRSTATQAQHTAATTDAMAYRLQVTHADDPGFRDPELVEDVVVDGTTHATQDVAYGDGAFLWRVQALDGSGHKLPWSAARPFTRDATRPRATAAPTRLAVDGALRVTFDEPVVGVSGATLQLAPVAADGTADRAALVTATVRATGPATALLTPAAPLVAGRTYQLLVHPGVRDLAGNSAVAEGPQVVVPTRMDDGSPALRYTAGWGFRTASNAVGGGFRTSFPTMRAQKAVSTSVYGRGVVVTGCVGPTGGLADLWVDGAKRARVDTYRSYSGCGVRIARWTGELGVHRVQLRGVGLKRAASRGTTVSVDAVDATP